MKEEHEKGDNEQWNDDTMLLDIDSKERRDAPKNLETPIRKKRYVSSSDSDSDDFFSIIKHRGDL